MGWRDQVVDKRYKLQEFLGQGGMAKVFLAEDLKLGRHVAIKILPTDKADCDGYVNRFRREFEVCASLNHPNIVKLYDCGEISGTSSLYYTMEVLACKDLKEVLKEQAILEPSVVKDIASQMVSAFDCYHEKKIVHRDLKPSNIMVDDTGRVVITDFGLVYDPNKTAMTKTGAVLGTPIYCAPEMLKGVKTTTSTDYYQLGVIIYECLCGQQPFTGGTIVDLAMSICKGRYKPVSEVKESLSKDWDQIIERCMAKDPAERYSGGEEFLADLKAVGRVNSLATKNSTKSSEVKKSKARQTSETRPSNKAAASEILVRKCGNPTVARSRNIIAAAVISVVILVLFLISYCGFKDAPSTTRLPVLSFLTKAPREVHLSWEEVVPPIASVCLLTDEGTLIDEADSENRDVRFFNLEPGKRYRLSFKNEAGAQSPSCGFTAPLSELQLKTFLPPGGYREKAAVVFETSSKTKLRITWSSSGTVRTLDLSKVPVQKHIFRYLPQDGLFTSLKVFSLEEGEQKRELSLPFDSLSLKVFQVVSSLNVMSELSTQYRLFKTLNSGHKSQEKLEESWSNILSINGHGFGDYMAVYPFISLLSDETRQNSIKLKEALLKVGPISIVPEKHKFEFPFNSEKSIEGIFNTSHELGFVMPDEAQNGKVIKLYAFNVRLDRALTYGGPPPVFVKSRWMDAGVLDASIQFTGFEYKKIVDKFEATTDLSKQDLTGLSKIVFRLCTARFHLDYRYGLSINGRDPIHLNNELVTYPPNDDPRRGGKKLWGTVVSISLPVEYFKEGTNTISLTLNDLLGIREYGRIPLVRSVHLLLEP